jgi:predicted AAA+ superfamily ATPase
LIFRGLTLCFYRIILRSSSAGWLKILYVPKLLKHGTWAEEDVNFYHFRDTTRREIDLVIERSDGNVAGVEVKASMTVRPDDFSGLVSFADYAGEKFLHGVLLYTGDKVLPFRINDRVFQALPVSFVM